MNDKTKKNKTTAFFFLYGLIGAAIGITLSITASFLNLQFSETLSAAYMGIQKASPWILAVFCIASMLAGWLPLARARSLSSLWDGEDDAAYERIDRLVNISLGIIGSATILGFVLFGLTTVSCRNGFLNTTLFLALALFYVVVMFLFPFIQRRAVNLVKSLNPEKKGDPLELHFQKTWLESCDEQERMVVYRASYRAYSSLPFVASVVFCILFLAVFFLNIGFLPFVAAGSMWLIPAVIYYVECNRK